MATDTPRPNRDEDQQVVYAILIGGGLLGGLMVVGALAASWYWWGPLVAWLRDGTRDDLWQFLLAEAVLIGGLAVMFAAFQTARRQERIDATQRRVLYGYNTGLQLFLVLKVLAIIVTFVSFRYPLPYDTTESGFFSLNEKTIRYVTELDRPVQIYMLMDQSDPAFGDMHTMLVQMAALNPRYFHFAEISKSGDLSRSRDLERRFKQFNPRSDGLLVAYGDKPEDNHSYIVAGELTNLDLVGNRPQRSFNGEVRLMQELQFLAEEKRRPIIYFTQGHGEPDILDRGLEGMTELVQRLGRVNFDVRPLVANDPDPQKNSVPPDADVVVIVGPQKPISDILPGLQRYMEPTDPKARKGKLVVLYGPTGPDREKGNTMRETGLEEFLRRYGVNATREQVLMYAFDQGGRPLNPENVVLGINNSAIESRHPIAAMLKEYMILWLGVRRLESIPATASAATFHVEPVLVTGVFTWTETDMTRSVEDTWRRINAGERERISKEPRIALAAVTESAAPEASPSGKPDKGARPRLIVAGCSSLATNKFQRSQTTLNFDLVRGSIDWCRERSANIGIEPKSYKYFMLNKQTTYWNLFYLPLAVLALGVVGLGLIVWNIRRS